MRNVSLTNKTSWHDIAIKEGKFIKIATNINEKGKKEIDAKGKFVSPPFVESHVHLDDALSVGNPRFNQSGTLQEAIAIAAQRKEHTTKATIKQLAKKVTKWLMAKGALHIRAHTDFSPDFKKLEAILELKQILEPYVHIQVVAFPQEGLFTIDGGKDLFEEAVKMGVDVVGGLPQAEITREDGIEHVHYAFHLANKHDKLIDIHTDETGDPNSRFLEVIAKYAIKYDMAERVTASHTTALHHYQNDYAQKVISHVKQAEMNIVTNPFSNTILQSRYETYPKSRGLTRVDELLAAGVNVSIGNDNIMDPFGPLGNGNMLHAANFLAHVAHLTNEEQLRQLYTMITTKGAKTLALTNYGIEEGNEANLVILDANNEREAIRRMSECLYIIKKGEIIGRTEPAKHILHFNQEKIQVDFQHDSL